MNQDGRVSMALPRGVSWLETPDQAGMQRRQPYGEGTGGLAEQRGDSAEEDALASPVAAAAGTDAARRPGAAGYNGFSATSAATASFKKEEDSVRAFSRRDETAVGAPAEAGAEAPLPPPPGLPRPLSEATTAPCARLAGTQARLAAAEDAHGAALEVHVAEVARLVEENRALRLNVTQLHADLAAARHLAEAAEEALSRLSDDYVRADEELESARRRLAEVENVAARLPRENEELKRRCAELMASRAAAAGGSGDGGGAAALAREQASRRALARAMEENELLRRANLQLAGAHAEQRTLAEGQRAEIQKLRQMITALNREKALQPAIEVEAPARHKSCLDDAAAIPRGMKDELVQILRHELTHWPGAANDPRLAHVHRELFCPSQDPAFLSCLARVLEQLLDESGIMCMHEARKNIPRFFYMAPCLHSAASTRSVTLFQLPPGSHTQILGVRANELRIMVRNGEGRENALPDVVVSAAAADVKCAVDPGKREICVASNGVAHTLAPASEDEFNRWRYALAYAGFASDLRIVDGATGPRQASAGLGGKVKADLLNPDGKTPAGRDIPVTVRNVLFYTAPDNRGFRIDGNGQSFFIDPRNVDSVIVDPNMREICFVSKKENGDTVENILRFFDERSFNEALAPVMKAGWSNFYLGSISAARAAEQSRQYTVDQLRRDLERAQKESEEKQLELNREREEARKRLEELRQEEARRREDALLHERAKQREEGLRREADDRQRREREERERVEREEKERVERAEQEKKERERREREERERRDQEEQEARRKEEERGAAAKSGDLKDDDQGPTPDLFVVEDQCLKLFEKTGDEEPVIVLHSAMCQTVANDAEGEFRITYKGGTEEEQIFFFKFEDAAIYDEKKAQLEKNGFFTAPVKPADWVDNQVCVVKRDSLELHEHYGMEGAQPVVTMQQRRTQASTDRPRRVLKLQQTTENGRLQRITLDCASDAEFDRWYTALLFGGFLRNDKNNATRRLQHLREYIFPISFFAPDEKEPRCVRVSAERAQIEIYALPDDETPVFTIANENCEVHADDNARRFRIYKNRMTPIEERLDVVMHLASEFDRLKGQLDAAGFKGRPANARSRGARSSQPPAPFVIAKRLTMQIYSSTRSARSAMVVKGLDYFGDVSPTGTVMLGLRSQKDEEGTELRQERWRLLAAGRPYRPPAPGELPEVFFTPTTSHELECWQFAFFISRIARNARNPPRYYMPAFVFGFPSRSFPVASIRSPPKGGAGGFFGRRRSSQGPAASADIDLAKGFSVFSRTSLGSAASFLPPPVGAGAASFSVLPPPVAGVDGGEVPGAPQQPPQNRGLLLPPGGRQFGLSKAAAKGAGAGPAGGFGGGPAGGFGGGSAGGGGPGVGFAADPGPAAGSPPAADSASPSPPATAHFPSLSPAGLPVKKRSPPPVIRFAHSSTLASSSDDGADVDEEGSPERFSRGATAGSPLMKPAFILQPPKALSAPAVAKPAFVTKGPRLLPAAKTPLVAPGAFSAVPMAGVKGGRNSLTKSLLGPKGKPAFLTKPSAGPKKKPAGGGAGFAPAKGAARTAAPPLSKPGWIGGPASPPPTAPLGDGGGGGGGNMAKKAMLPKKGKTALTKRKSVLGFITQRQPTVRAEPPELTTYAGDGGRSDGLNDPVDSASLASDPGDEEDSEAIFAVGPADTFSHERPESFVGVWNRRRFGR